MAPAVAAPSFLSRNSVMLFACAFLLQSDQNLLAPHLSAVADEFGMSDVERDEKLGGELAMGLFLLGAPAALALGAAADACDRVRLFAAILVVGGAASAGTAFAASYGALFWWRALTGVSLGASLPFASLLSQLDELRSALARHAARGLLDGGGFHLMRYPPGAKFMRHVDEDPSMFEPRRNSISFLLYLTPDDWSDDDGGSLIIYDSTAGDEGRRVRPVAGSLVVYDSTLEHEVTATRRPRFLISGRFRELDADWSERRARSA